ncbi:MAG: LPS export ABC transporter periplasmic protein LptC [Prevotella sp.]|jgi:hypothetical protein
MPSLISCQEQVEHTAPAIHARDSVPLMKSYGVNTLISDSGVIKYRIVTEQWIVNPNLNPSRYIFDKGVLLTQFDEKFNVNSYIQCDTAFYYDKKKLWELRSRVRILTKSGIRFSSEELFWDENKHELYSNKFSRLITPDRSLQGRYFRSDERMTKYYVSNTSGSFVKGDITGGPTTTPTTGQGTTDSIQQPAIPQTRPRPRTNN